MKKKKRTTVYLQLDNKWRRSPQEDESAPLLQLAQLKKQTKIKQEHFFNAKINK